MPTTHEFVLAGTPGKLGPGGPLDDPGGLRGKLEVRPAEILVSFGTEAASWQRFVWIELDEGRLHVRCYNATSDGPISVTIPLAARMTTTIDSSAYEEAFFEAAPQAPLEQGDGDDPSIGLHPVLVDASAVGVPFKVPVEMEIFDNGAGDLWTYEDGQRRDLERHESGSIVWRVMP